MTLETATFAGGCFWCIETVFNRLVGVESALSGYMGGHTADPTYRDICNGDTGHAEVVQVRFNPEAITYRDLLDVFFTIHDPTQLNRQGNDVGTQYRSAIFHHSHDQFVAAREKLAELAAGSDAQVVTVLQPAETFYVAEDYHQRYYEINPEQPYCRHVVAPKVLKAQTRFARWLKP